MESRVVASTERNIIRSVFPQTHQYLLVGCAHAVGLAGACLAVGEDSHVVASKQLLHDGLHGALVQLLVGAVGAEGEVVGECLHRVGVVDEDLKVTIC